MKGQSEINKAAGEMPKAEVRKPPAGDRGMGSDVGNEQKADVRGVQEGGSAAEGAHNPLHGAMRELHEQHPIPYHDHGPHHGRSDHVRHMPLHGLRPHKAK